MRFEQRFGEDISYTPLSPFLEQDDNLLQYASFSHKIPDLKQYGWLVDYHNT